MKHVKCMLLAGLLCGLFGMKLYAQQETSKIDSAELKLRQNYTKREVMIPMRDGVKLFTSIYEPKDRSEKHPILMMRTPYSCEPYGDKFGIKENIYTQNRYILVYQDIRGRHKSEGEFVQIRPLNKNKKSKKDIDEATDTYDTIEWLLKNTYNNGNAGTWGISYDGFQATMTASSNHPALKAVSPQGPVTDWFRGDDRHHNGAFTFLQTTNFLPWLEGRHAGKGVMKEIVKNDVYTDFLRLGTFKDADALVQDTTETLWNLIKKHPNFDAFWQERDARQSCYNLKPAMLVAGGLFDSEDCYGAWNTYKAIKVARNRTLSGLWSVVARSMDSSRFRRLREYLFREKYLEVLSGRNRISILPLLPGRKRRKAETSCECVPYWKERMGICRRMAASGDAADTVLYSWRRFCLY